MQSKNAHETKIDNLNRHISVNKIKSIDLGWALGQYSINNECNTSTGKEEIAKIISVDWTKSNIH